MVRFVIRIAAVAILLVLPLVLPAPILAQTRTSSAGYPNISGEWMEAGVRVQIVQRGSSFTATSSRGSTSWRMDGNVSRDGVVTGKLEHTAGVSPSAKGFAQNRRMTLSPDGRTLKGQATFIGKKGGHSLTWTRSSPPPTPGSPPGRSACGLGSSWKVVAGCWPGVYIRRGSSNVFDAEMTQVNGDRYTAVVVVSIDGNQVSATQTDTGGGKCYLRNGLLSADGRTITGTYECHPAGKPVQYGCFIGAIQCADTPR